MDWILHSENPALARKAWWSSLWSAGPCRMKNIEKYWKIGLYHWPWLKDWLTNHDSSLAGSWTGQCCSKKQVLAHVGCEMLSGKHSTLSWFSSYQGFSGLWGHGTYIWYSSHMLSFPHDITRSTSNTTTIRYETIRMLACFWKHSGQSSITSTRPVAPPWSNMSGFLHAKTKTAWVACSHPPAAPGVSADLWFSCNEHPKPSPEPKHLHRLNQMKPVNDFNQILWLPTIIPPEPYKIFTGQRETRRLTCWWATVIHYMHTSECTMWVGVSVSSALLNFCGFSYYKCFMFQSAFAVRIEEMYLAAPTTKSAMRFTSEFKFFLSGRGSNIQLQNSSKQFLPPMWCITFHQIILIYTDTCYSPMFLFQEVFKFKSTRFGQWCNMMWT